jgi:uncharacterized protein YndB with AHSA1/START domain
MAKPQSGFLMIADITGYTSYLSESELEHAQEVLQALLELLVDRTKPPLVISRLAGDAVVSYAIASRPVQGQAFVEMIEDTYVAFRKAVNQMVLNTTCRCNACANINALDLKFFVHHGTFSIQTLAAHEELVGHDVNTLFRMTKNDVVDRTGIRAYTLYSEAAVRALDLAGFEETLVAHTGEYDDVGTVAGWVQDMHPVWEAKSQSVRIGIEEGDVLFRVEQDYPFPPEIVWDYLTRPEFRATFSNAERQQVHNRQGGRVGTGTVYECFHGSGKPTTQTVLEWQPFERMVTQTTTPVPKAVMLGQIDLVPAAGGGTRMVQLVSKARGPLLMRLLCNLAARLIATRETAKGMAALGRQMEQDGADGTIVVPEASVVAAGDIADAAARSLEQDG